MRAVVHPSQIGGAADRPVLYKPPPSKSHFQRLCAAALLREGTTTIQNPGRSADDAAALRIIQDLGADVEQMDGALKIQSNGKVRPRTGVINCGESGLSARLFAPIAALADVPVEIQGEGSLLARPMRGIVEALRVLGAAVETNDGCLPLKVLGPVEPQSLTVDGSGSSQTVSGLLFALASSAITPLTLRADGLVSRPYLEMSCEVLRDFGWDVAFDGAETCFIGQAHQFSSTDTESETEADWSSIAQLAVGSVFGGKGLWIDTWRSETQADARILDILKETGANVHKNILDETCYVSPHFLQAPFALRAFQVDCTHFPDLIPILTILATACDGQSRISGLNRLTHKESDRTKTTSALLTALTIDHHIENDAFFISGPKTPRSNTVSGCNDHRIVMAAAIAALRADGPVTIEGAEAVRKSYPDFFDDLQKLGVKLELIP